jgi:hypothetical protein
MSLLKFFLLDPDPHSFSKLDPDPHSVIFGRPIIRLFKNPDNGYLARYRLWPNTGYPSGFPAQNFNVF